MNVHITLLGGFAVTVDGAVVPADAWSRRHASALVKVLALARSRRLHRDQVIDLLWPDTPPEAAMPRLHKAAHFARRALGPDGTASVVLRNDVVALWPGAEVVVDAARYRAEAESALAAGSAERAVEALSLYGGPLLPDDLYEPWTQEPRESLRLLHLELLRLAGRWEEVLQADPADEQAHLAIARRWADDGDQRAALRQLERLDQAVRRELGTTASPAAEELRAAVLAALSTGGRPVGTPKAGTRLVGRREAGDRIRARLDQADHGRGGALLVSGPPGVGKTAVLDMATAVARQHGWRVGRGTASSVEGPWPYAPVLEALADLCRQHPTLLDGLDDIFRDEVDRALSGREVAWSGETAHQRLFLAAAELLRLAAAGHGLLLVVDDIHEADQGSLRLLHYLARCAVADRVVLLLSHRPETDDATREVLQSLVARGVGAVLELNPLDQAATHRLVAHRFPSLDDETVQRIWAVSAGLPFSVLELGRAAESGRPPTIDAALPLPVRQTFQRVALLGTTFTTDELLAVAGTSEEQAYRHLDTALTALVVEPAPPGYRFRHALIRDALLDGMPPQERTAARVQVAEQLAALGAAPARVAHQLLAAGQHARAIPFVLPAVETAGALGAYRDALALVDAVLEHSTGEDRGRLLARRGDLLMALGDPGSVDAYRAAVPATTGTQHRLVRARLARAACFTEDLPTAAAALAGLGLEQDAADGPILLARGNLSWFSGDVDAAWDAAATARSLLLTPDDPWHYIDLVGLQGLIAHQRGEWFERFRLELRRTRGHPALATALFDAHLCVAEYLLYGPTPYSEVLELAEGLRHRAGQEGALRGVAFATSLLGEAALLMGDLDRAECELQEAADLHHDVDATAGEAHSLQRLAEVRLARGDRAGAQRLLGRALPLARWSAIGKHLLQRVYGTMIMAAADPVEARAIVDQAEATMGEADACPLCDVMLAVPATIACADAGDLTAAQRHLAVAEASARRWEGSAWEAGVREARAHLARARGDEAGFHGLLDEACRLFTAAGQPLDADRCERAQGWQPAPRPVPDPVR